MNSKKDAPSSQRFLVGVVDADGWRLACDADEDLALTLFGVASEDPANWQEVVAYWPRYCTPVVAEFAEGTPLVKMDESTVRASLDSTDHWFVMDLIRKRIVFGKGFEPVGRDQVYDLTGEEKVKQRWVLSIHLPPWWELHEQVAVSVIDAERVDPIRRPRTNRSVLFGEPMIEDLANRLWQVTQSQWRNESPAALDSGQQYALTVQVHRDWLMTPREDLDGQTPRQLLHGAMDWIDKLTRSQQLRSEDGLPIVAAPTDVAGYDSIPMGREEICAYFDLCRAIIEAGWDWCRKLDTPEQVTCVDGLTDLKAYLRDYKTRWINGSFTDGSPPRFVLECSRRRVPRGIGVEIVGMDERETAHDLLDCDCPLCKMMADGDFGVGFSWTDGHHLELDDEFAFSLCETREEWEEQQRDFGYLPAAMDC